MFDTLRAITRSLSRGVFPHQWASLLDAPGRQLLLSPATLASRLPLHAGSRVLEIGAGSGRYSGAVSARCGRLSLLDLQPEMLQKAKARLTARTGLHGVIANAMTLPFRSESFDVIYMVDRKSTRLNSSHLVIS